MALKQTYVYLLLRPQRYPKALARIGSVGNPDDTDPTSQTATPTQTDY